MSAKPVVDFLLRDEATLKIAAAVHDAWPETQISIAHSFLNRLGDRLRTEFPGWSTWAYKGYFQDTDAAYLLHKETWEHEYFVSLEASEYGARLYLGVQRASKIVESRGYSLELLQAVQKLHPTAKQAKWWEAVALMRYPATNWRTPDVLWKMYRDETFLEAVAEQMIAIAKDVEPILDQMAKKPQ